MGTFTVASQINKIHRLIKASFIHSFLLFSSDVFSKITIKMHSMPVLNIIATVEHTPILNL